MRFLFPLVCTLFPFILLAQDTVYLQSAVRYDVWLSFTESWEPQDSTAISYRFDRLRDSITEWTYNGESWSRELKTIYRYRADGQNATTFITQFDESGTPVANRRTLFDYNTDGQVRLVMNQIDEDGIWMTTARVTYTYTGNQIAAINRERLRPDGSVDLERTEFQYDAIGNLTEELTKNLVGDSLQNNFRIRQAFSIEGDLIERVEEEWSFGNWLPRGLTEFSYFRTSEIEVDTAVTFQFLGGAWRRFFRDIETQDLIETRNSSTLFQQSAGSGWADLSRTLRVYDSDTRIQTITAQQNIGSWQNLNRIINQYDDLDRLAERINQSPVDTSWSNQFRYIYFYTPFSEVSTSVQQPPLTGVRLYPVPAIDHLIIDLMDQPSNFTTFRLYDSQGRLRIHQVINQRVERIHLPDFLPTGTYVVTLQNENGRGSWPILHIKP